MALLGALLLMELSAAVTLFCEGRWGLGLAIVAAMVGQVTFAASFFQKTQRRRRFYHVLDMVNRGRSREEAQMSAHYHHPDIRVFARFTKDALRSLIERKG